MVLGGIMISRYQPQIIIKPYKKRKKRIKKWLIGILIIGFILTLSIYLGLNFIVKRELKEIEEIKKENNYFRKKIQKLSNSNASYEEILRTKYGYIKKGEKIIIYSPLYYKNREIEKGVKE